MVRIRPSTSGRKVGHRRTTEVGYGQPGSRFHECCVSERETKSLCWLSKGEDVVDEVDFIISP